MFIDFVPVDYRVVREEEKVGYFIIFLSCGCEEKNLV